MASPAAAPRHRKVLLHGCGTVPRIALPLTPTGKETDEGQPFDKAFVRAEEST
jgi:hypothetical protein